MLIEELYYSKMAAWCHGIPGVFGESGARMCSNDYSNEANLNPIGSPSEVIVMKRKAQNDQVPPLKNPAHRLDTSKIDTLQFHHTTQKKIPQTFDAHGF